MLRLLLPLSIALMILFGCKKQDSSQSLFQTWRVESLLKDGSMSLQYPADTLLITFENNKTYSVQLEINSCGGSFTLEQPNLSLGAMACTEACCDSEFSADLLYTLDRVDSYNFAAEYLNLTGDSDRVVRCVKFP